MSESKYLLSGPNKCSIFLRRKYFILCHYIFFMRNIGKAFYDGSRSGDSGYSAELEKQTHQQSVTCWQAWKLYVILAQQGPTHGTPQPVPSRQNLDIRQDQKIVSCSASSSHLYQQSETLRGCQEALHCARAYVRELGNEWTKYTNLHCIFLNIFCHVRQL